MLFLRETDGYTIDDLYQICVKANKRLVVGQAAPTYTNMTGRSFIMRGNYAIKKGIFKIQLADPDMNKLEKFELYKAPDVSYEFDGVRSIGKQTFDKGIIAYYEGEASYYNHGCDMVLGY
ncbi:hypothetical protein PSBY109024_06385 [Pseudoalteromonas byunsanensis]